jgi:AcrR family transcriptional regulator
MKNDTSGDPATVSTQTPARRRRERERAAARDLILSAARDLARREGWDAVTMRRLADEIGYSSNFAYRYFAGRDEILRAVIRDGFARLRDAMADAAARMTSRSAGAAVRRAGHAYLDFAIAEPDLYQLMYGLGGVRVPATDTWIEGQAVGDEVARLLKAAGDAQHERHVLQLWATAHGLIALQVVGRVVADPAALHALLEDAMADCLAVALPRPQASRPGTRSNKTSAS